MVLNSKTLVQRVAKQAVATLVKELGDGSGGGETTLGDVEVGLADAPHADTSICILTVRIREQP